MDTYFLLGKAYHINNQFDNAIETYEKYRRTLTPKNITEIEYVNAHIKACEVGKRMVSNPVDAIIEPFEGSLKYDSDIYNPIISGNGTILIFLSDRNHTVKIMISKRQGDSWSKPLAINQQIGLEGEAYPVSLSYDGSELYIVAEDKYNMDIFVSHYDGHRWTHAIKLNNNINTKYAETHACISRDGQTLYFTSNRKGSIGGLDIYMAIRISGDEWGEAENMGNAINTAFNEDTPFLTNNDSRLYFSSEGHSTMGGYDIFYCDKNPKGIWNFPTNVGYPINTADDDIFYNPGWDDSQALYAMESGDNNKSLKICRVQLYEKQPEQLAANPITRRSPDNRMTSTEESEIETNPLIPEEKEASSVDVHYIFNNILFDYNQTSLDEDALRDVQRICVLMRKYPEIKIELTGHADAKGIKDFNMTLSRKRAQSVANNLKSNGIDNDRIIVQAAGESDPIAINQYKDGSDAPEGRRLNRRVSIKLTNFNSDKIQMADVFVPNELMISPENLFQDNSATEFSYSQSYTIQIMALKKPRKVSYFKNLRNVQRYKCSDGFYRYVTGEYDGIEEARMNLSAVRNKGYEDAMIKPISRYLELTAEK